MNRPAQIHSPFAQVGNTAILTEVDPLPTIPHDMVADLRSDHAGETGAVCIYRGILAISRDNAVRAFAQEHLKTEQQHLALLTALLPTHQRSKLLPLWRIAGWLTGALPAIFGSKQIYLTIDSVETYVDQHYAEQVDKLRSRPADRELLKLLEACRLDEVAHRDDARGRYTTRRTFGRLWAWLGTWKRLKYAPCLSLDSSSVLQLRLHRPAMRPTLRLEDEPISGANYVV